MLKIKIVFFAFEIRLPTTIKNVTSACKKWTRLACARVRCFPFLPSPFTSMPYFLIDKRLQVKAKTVFAFTPCDSPFLTQRGREIPHENEEKAVDFDQKRAYLRAKTHNNSSDSRTAVKAKVNTDLHLFLHRINLIYCTLYK